MSVAIVFDGGFTLRVTADTAGAMYVEACKALLRALLYGMDKTSRAANVDVAGAPRFELDPRD